MSDEKNVVGLRIVAKNSDDPKAEAKALLTEMLGEDVEDVVICAYLSDGSMLIRSSCSDAETMLAMERAKFSLLYGSTGGVDL